VTLSCQWAPITKLPRDVVSRAHRGLKPAAYDPLVDRSSPAGAPSAADVAAALAPRISELATDIYDLIVREIPQLRTDGRVLALLEASVGENVTTVLHILQHGIDLDRVHAPSAAEAYARRLAQRGIAMAALLRAYRLGAARFQDCAWRNLGGEPTTRDRQRSRAAPGRNHQRLRRPRV